MFLTREIGLFLGPSQPATTCSKLTIETLEQRCEICSKLTIKTPTRRYWRRFGVFIVNLEHISHLCSSVSIANFEQVHAGWDTAQDPLIFGQKNIIHLKIQIKHCLVYYSGILHTCIIV